jgi:hypothetical protein
MGGPWSPGSEPSVLIRCWLILINFQGLWVCVMILTIQCLLPLRYVVGWRAPAENGASLYSIMQVIRFSCEVAALRERHVEKWLRNQEA